MGIGVLTKGPVGFLLPFLTMVVYLLATKNFRYFKKLEIPWGVVTVLVIVAAWLAPACIRGGEAYTQIILFKQTLKRFADAWTHQRPFYYYLTDISRRFCSLDSFIARSASVGVFKRRAGATTKFLFSLCWFFTILFFSVSRAANGNFMFFALSGRCVACRGCF